MLNNIIRFDDPVSIQDALTLAANPDEVKYHYGELCRGNMLVDELEFDAKSDGQIVLHREGCVVSVSHRHEL